MAKDYGLEINDEVIVKMASVAILETEGVAGLVSKTANLKEIFLSSDAARAIKILKKNDATEITVYISVKDGYDVRTIAAAVQNNVKSKLQNMTGNAVEKVNVVIEDVEFQSNDKEK